MNYCCSGLFYFYDIFMFFFIFVFFFKKKKLQMVSELLFLRDQWCLGWVLKDAMEAESSFSSIAPLVFDGDNYQFWAVKMETYLDVMDL